MTPDTQNEPDYHNQVQYVYAKCVQRKLKYYQSNIYATLQSPQRNHEYGSVYTLPFLLYFSKLRCIIRFTKGELRTFLVTLFLPIFTDIYLFWYKFVRRLKVAYAKA